MSSPVCKLKVAMAAIKANACHQVPASQQRSSGPTFLVPRVSLDASEPCLNSKSLSTLIQSTAPHANMGSRLLEVTYPLETKEVYLPSASFFNDCCKHEVFESLPHGWTMWKTCTKPDNLESEYKNHSTADSWNAIEIERAVEFSNQMQNLKEATVAKK